MLERPFEWVESLPVRGGVRQTEVAVRRFHLFELEDQSWFPSSIRNLMTDYLHHVTERFGLFDGAAPVLGRLLGESGSTEILDLGSGGGGPWRSLAPRLAAGIPELRVTLSDLYPNRSALEAAAASDERIRVAPGPVDAMAAPAEFDAVRTQFLSLHHFRPEGVVRILRNALERGVPIALFEAQKRDVPHLIQFALSPVAVLLLTPTIRPVRALRLLFTYLIPVVPICVFWDGVVSVLRTYTLPEMLELASRADPDGRYRWEVGENGGRGPTMTWMAGAPKEGG